MPSKMQTKDVLRASAVLTTDYVATTSVNLDRLNGVAFFLSFTKGSLTSYQFKVQLSPDPSDTADASSDWYDMPKADSTIWEPSYTDATLNVYAPVPLSGMPVPVARKARVVAKGTGTVTNSLCAVWAVRYIDY